MRTQKTIQAFFPCANRLLALAVSLFGIVFVNCAYLNTFYNAKTAFDKAFSAHMKLVHSQTDTTVDLPADIIAGYDRTITKTGKVIDIYPKRKKWHDDAVFLSAKATFYKGEYNTAIRRFKQFQKVYPTSPFIPESYLFIGKAYLKDNSFEKAEETFRFILEKYPRLNDREEVTLLIAQVAIQREGKSQAIHILEKSLKSVKSEERKIEIIIKLTGLYIDLAMYEKAIATLIRAPRNKDYQDYLFQIDYNLLICYKELDQHTKALELIAVMLKNNAYIKQTPRILLEKGIVLTRMGKTKEAIAVFEQITEGSTVEVEIKGRAWYELGCIYQHRMGDFEKARECYQNALSVITDNRIKELAQQRIDGIENRKKITERIEELKKRNIPADSSDTVVTALYSLGEIYWLNLAEPDSALNQFHAIIRDTGANTELVMKSLYASAWIQRFIKKDSLNSDSLYRVIITRFPATAIAKRSQFDLGVPVTVKTREDSAHLAFVEAERFYFNNNKAVDAVNAYYKVAKQYADVPSVASNSLYSAAWLCDHVLNKNKKALMLYRMLCKEYPESELCVNEAKPLIKIVEDTLKVLARQRKAVKNIPDEKKNPVEQSDTTGVPYDAEMDDDALDTHEDEVSEGSDVPEVHNVPDATTIQDSVPDVSPEEVPQEAPVRKKILGRRHVPSSGKTNEETEDD